MLKFTLFWFRRDLRLSDNAGLFHALKDNKDVLPIFIFDTSILNRLNNAKDRRVTFIHAQIQALKDQLGELGSDLAVFHGDPIEVFTQILSQYKIQKVYANHDYEPYARERDKKIRLLLEQKGIEFLTFKDQCIFEKNEILSESKKPYTVYTPYKKKWLATLTEADYASFSCEKHFGNFAQLKTSNRKQFPMISLKDMGFEFVDFKFPDKTWDTKAMKNYKQQRDFPAQEGATSGFGLHLRFGTMSVRELVRKSLKQSDVWLSELIWREFFMQILWHFPHVEKKSFRPQYESVAWRNKKSEFDLWATGQTGYPMVDAGIRELLQTGFMHNRVRMVVASFLTKHLLTHWYLGERFFAAHLLDYDLAANNGNWQWAAGTGCDAAPYFRVFNPAAQTEKFDPDYIYIRKWIPEWGTKTYPKPMVEHSFARKRALDEYKKGIESYQGGIQEDV
jgi:deoxyribodipyrimidine photo-lyase